MLKILDKFETKGRRRRNIIQMNLEEDKEEDYIKRYNDITKYIEQDLKYDYKNIEISINEYVTKLRKQLILMEKLKQKNNYGAKNLINFRSQKSLVSGRISIRSKEELIKTIRKGTIHDISNIIWNEPEQYGQKMTMALNLLQIPFLKFRINPRETLEELEYIFNKNNRTLNEMIYLQHLLTLFDVVPSIYTHYDLIDPNEVLFNMAICLNMHKFTKDQMIFRYGEYNDKLFFIVNGSVSLFEPVEKKCLMNINEYINYLNKLEKIEEYELIRKIIDLNKVYKNNNEVLKIKINNDKFLRKKYFQMMKASKDLNKYQDNSTLEVNLNLNINLSIKTLTDYINFEEMVSCEKYIDRVEPDFNSELKIDKNESEEEESSNSKSETENKSVIKYFKYSLVKKVVPFNIFGEMIIDDDESKNNIGNNNNVYNFKKRELTAICNEPSRILYLDLNNWKKYFRYRQDSIKTKNISTILDIPFLRNINIEYFKTKIFEHFSLFNYKIGEFIFKQNDRRKKIYFIRSGEVQLIMKASVSSINKIIDKKFDKNDIIFRSRIPKTQNMEFNDSEYLMNFLNNDRKIKIWKILGIYPKDIIGLDEIVDENNKYYFSAKCTSYNCEIYEIDYKKFKDMVEEDKNVKNLYEQYTKNKMEFLSKRLKNLRTLYINDKFNSYNNYNKNCFTSEDKIKNKNNQFSYKKNHLKLNFINNIFEPTLSSNNLQALSENIINNNFEKSPNNEDDLLTLPYNSNIEKNEKLISNNKINNEQIKTNKMNTNRKLGIILSAKKPKKININLNLKLNNFYNMEKEKKEKKFHKTHTFFKNKSQKLIKFKEFNGLIKEHKKLKSKKLKYCSSHNSILKHYIKEVKTSGVDQARKLEINPFSDVLFSLAQKNNKNLIKSNSSSFIQPTSNCCSKIIKNTSSPRFLFNKVEFLILDKIVDKKGYSNENEFKSIKNRIKEINNNKKFPQHLIRRFEVNRKIDYFPEKYLYFAK